MLRRSRSLYSKIDLSAYTQGRAKAPCSILLDSNHCQVKYCLHSSVVFMESASLHQCVCEREREMSIHTFAYIHAHILESLAPETVVHRHFSS